MPVNSCSYDLVKRTDGTMREHHNAATWSLHGRTFGNIEYSVLKKMVQLSHAVKHEERCSLKEDILFSCEAMNAFLILKNNSIFT